MAKNDARAAAEHRGRRHVSSAEGPAAARARLAELHVATTRRARELQAGFDDIIEAASDVATDDEHDPEGHTIAWERQQLAALLQDARAELAEIEAAVRRLDEGTYGTCEACGRPIAAERLEALPATRTCVGCVR